MKRTALLICLIFTLLLFPLKIYAEAQLSISPSLLYFDYTEFSSNGSTLDTETGWIPGIQLHINKRLNEQQSIELELITYGGDVDYDGRTQTGSPHSTATKENIFKLGGRIKISLSTDTNLMFGTRYNEWKRDIYNNNGIYGLLEIYKWWEISAGISSKLWGTNTQLWRIDASVLRTINPTIHVDLSRADYGTTDLNLGADWGARLQLSWMHKQVSNWQYGFNIFHEAWNFGRSNSRATTGGTNTASFYEPYSETRHSGLQLIITKNY